MISPFYLLSFLFSTTLAFFTTAFIIHALILIARIRNQRLRYFLRLIPYICVLLDFLTFKFNLSNWLNPLSCHSCTQKILLNIFFPDLKFFLSTQHISLIHYLTQKDSHYFGVIFTTIFLSLSAFWIVKSFLEIFLSQKTLKKMIKEAQPCLRSITNCSLQYQIDKSQTQILVSEAIRIPMATSYKTILFPNFMVEKLTQEEYEAILAHELEHLLFKDPFLKMFIHGFISFFWWIPQKSWIKKMEQEQEMGCDQNIAQYNIAQESLASALVKVSVCAQDKKLSTGCYLMNHEHPVIKRMKAMLKVYPCEKFTLLGLLFIILGCIFFIFCLLQ